MAKSLRLFISYRRDDNYTHIRPVVRNIYERLADHYGDANVFMDVDTIPPGADFVEFLGAAVARADVLLAVIGEQWVDHLQRRAEEEDDFVRIELESALERSIPIVPLVIGRAVMPGRNQLPESIAALARRNAFPIDVERDFHAHMSRLISALDAHYQESGTQDVVTGISAQPAASTARRVGDRFTNSLGMEMIWCPPGTFFMGSPEGEGGRSRIEVRHEVTLTKGFWMARHLVTQEQWEQVMGANPSHFKASGKDAPVESVDWQQATDFCAKLTQAEGAKGTYRLPTEAEWEYACRAGTTGPYAGSSLDEMGWYSADSKGKTHPVGQKAANPWGLQDMHGNVNEWCLDGYEENLGTAPVTDPTAPNGAAIRVIRGGGWGNRARGCRSAFRDGYVPDFRSNFLGFRPVLVPAQTQVPGPEDQE